MSDSARAASTEKSVVNAPILLYDGVCALCNGAVKTILKFDTTGTMRFAALDSSYGKTVLTRHPQLATIDSLVVIDDPNGPGEQLRLRSDGWLRVIQYLGGPWRVLLLTKLIPRPLRDAAYQAVARVRYRVFGQYDTCPVPPPEVRARFLA